MATHSRLGIDGPHSSWAVVVQEIGRSRSGPPMKVRKEAAEPARLRRGYASPPPRNTTPTLVKSVCGHLCVSVAKTAHARHDVASEQCTANPVRGGDETRDRSLALQRSGSSPRVRHRKGETRLARLARSWLAPSRRASSHIVGIYFLHACLSNGLPLGLERHCPRHAGHDDPRFPPLRTTPGLRVVQGCALRVVST